MGTSKKPAKRGARSVSNRSPSTPQKRSQAPQQAISAPEPVKQTRLSDYLQSQEYTVEMWKGHTPHFSGGPATRYLAAMDRALSSAFAISRLLNSDERGMRDARANCGDEEYKGLDDFYRSALFEAQDVLLLEVCGGMDTLRNMASRGDL